MVEKKSKSPTVAVAGGSGFVGTYLRRNLSEYFHFRGLTRSESRANAQPRQTHTEWVLCDLFSLPQVEKALDGVDFAIYLVHSMLPSSRLTQGNFTDLDLLLADNFSRACRSAPHLPGRAHPRGRRRPLPPLG